MKTIRTVAELRAELAPGRREGKTIGLVPTMGALHGGHLSLLDRARERTDVVVMSLFVNPTQFNESADLDAYPRDEARDARLAAEHGTDILFAPDAGEVYPDGFASAVEVVGALTDPLEGAHRPGHFRGVTTVVAKLFNVVRPDVAFFGQKDAQQALVIRRMAIDLDFGIEIAICETVREHDGLAMSSRNVHLPADDRRRAAAIRRGLRAAETTAARGERSAEEILAAARAEMTSEGIGPEYLALVSAHTLEPVTTLNGNAALLAVAARVGDTRLIDNTFVTADGPNDN